MYISNLVQILPNLFRLAVSLCTQMLKDNLNMYKRNIIKLIRIKIEGKNNPFHYNE